MRRCALFLGLAAVSMPGGVAVASDPVGIYAVVHKVVLEPGEEAPERIQIWGAFVLSGAGREGTGPYESELGGFYEEPQWGYLYYSLPEGQEELARTEWADMKRIAGAPFEAIAFASRYERKGRVRPARERPEAPDVYPVNMGITLLRSDSENPPVKAVLSLPAPVSPADASSVALGKVTLTVHNLRYLEVSPATYYFAIADSSGAREDSPGVPGDKWQTGWTPEMTVRLHQEYTWRAWGVDGDYKGPVLTTAFIPHFLRGDSNGDDEVDISDAIALLGYLFQGAPAPRPLEAGDMNASGDLDLSDGVYLLAYLFRGGPMPPDPFPAPGPKPTG